VYDEQLADRIRELLLFEPDAAETRMFGGLSFLVGGHIAVAVSRDGGLLMRAESEQRERLLQQPHVRPAVMGSREMRGWVRIDEDGVITDEALRHWVETGVALARAVPPA